LGGDEKTAGAHGFRLPNWSNKLIAYCKPLGLIDKCFEHEKAKKRRSCLEGGLAGLDLRSDPIEAPKITV